MVDKGVQVPDDLALVIELFDRTLATADRILIASYFHLLEGDDPMEGYLCALEEAFEFFDAEYERVVRRVHAQHQERIEAGLDDGWRPVVDMLRAVSLLGDYIAVRILDVDQGAEPEPTCSALALLHGRGNRTLREITLLIENGYAEAAYARWRTLHEIELVAEVLALFDDDVLATRFLEHRRLQFVRDCERLPEAMRPPEYLTIKQEVDAFCVQAPPSFSKNRDYGWLSAHFHAATGREPQSLNDLSTLVRSETGRGPVLQANHRVHGGSAGVAINTFQEHGATNIMTGPAFRKELGYPSVLAIVSMTTLHWTTISLWQSRFRVEDEGVGNFLMALAYEMRLSFQRDVTQLYDPGAFLRIELPWRK